MRGALASASRCKTLEICLVTMGSSPTVMLSARSSQTCDNSARVESKLTKWCIQTKHLRPTQQRFRNPRPSTLPIAQHADRLVDKPLQL